MTVKPLARVLAAWSLFTAGQWMFAVAVSVYAFGVDAATGVGAVVVARLLPAAVAAAPGGVLVDRFDRTRVVAICALVAAAATACAAALASSAADELAGLLVMTALVSAASAPVRPALQSLLPALARSPAELTRSTAVWSAMDSIGFILGAGFGGALIAMTSVATVLAVAAAVVAVAAAVAIGLPAVVATAPDDDMSVGGGFLDGVRAVRRTSLLHAPFALYVGVVLLEGTTDVQLVALALDDLDLGDGGPGLLYATWGVGGLVGSWVLLQFVRRVGYGRALLVCSAAFGLTVALCGAGGTLLVLAALVPVGIAYSVVESAVMGVIPRLADDVVVGRVYAVSELLHAGVSAVGAIFAPLLIHFLGIRTSLVAVGLAFAASTLLARRASTRIDAGEQVAGRVRELLRHVPFLAPLPLPRLERLVRAARRIEFAPGARIIAAGEVGDEFYVIDAGAVDIVEYRRRQVAGEGFGEIALLRDVPRTATVRAAEDTVLWALTRPTFLAAVGASGEITAAAEAVVEEHLARPRAPQPGPGVRPPDDPAAVSST